MAVHTNSTLFHGDAAVQRQRATLSIRLLVRMSISFNETASMAYYSNLYYDNSHSPLCFCYENIIFVFVSVFNNTWIPLAELHMKTMGISIVVERFDVWLNQNYKYDCLYQFRILIVLPVIFIETMNVCFLFYFRSIPIQNQFGSNEVYGWLQDILATKFAFCILQLSHESMWAIESKSYFHRFSHERSVDNDRINA